MITASKLELAFKCLWPFQNTEKEGESSHAAVRGSIFHTACEACVNGQSVDRSALRAHGLEADFDAWEAWAQKEGLFGLPEVALAFDPVTVRSSVVGRSIGRAYGSLGLPEQTIFGSADHIDFQSQVIFDWKTGKIPPNVDTSLQMRFLAMALALALDLHLVTVKIVHVRDATVTVTAKIYTRAELDDFAQKLAALATMVEGAQPQKGAHCRSLYCKFYGSCPATGIGRTDEDFPVVASADRILSPDHAGSLYALARDLGAASSSIFSAVREWAEKNGEFVTPHGQSVSMAKTTRRSVECNEKALEWLQRFFGTLLEEAVEKSFTAERLHQITRKKAASEGRKITDVEKEVYAALSALGAVKTTVSKNWRENDTK